MQDNKINDVSNSNNGDIVKVLSTIIAILKEFTNDSPGSKIFFTGSTALRTVLYHRIIKNYNAIFTNEFVVTALVKTEKGMYKEVLFDVLHDEKYFGFFVKKK